MLESRTPVEDLPVLLDLFKLALAVHVAAEGKVLGSMVVRSMAPASLRALAAEAHREHVEQQRATDALATQPPGSDAWYASALELRVLVADHASRAELSRWAWLELLPGPVCARSRAGTRPNGCACSRGPRRSRSRGPSWRPARVDQARRAPLVRLTL